MSDWLTLMQCEGHHGYCFFMSLEYGQRCIHVLIHANIWIESQGRCNRKMSKVVRITTESEGILCNGSEYLSVYVVIERMPYHFHNPKNCYGLNRRKFENILLA